LRQNLTKHLDGVCENRAPLLVTRQSGEPVVMLSLAEKLLWSDNGWEDYLYRQNCDRNGLHRINSLVLDILRNLYAGIGKPEPLRGDLAGW
jgi:YoeB-like toxin of bacterial type II toxin-antitoxin system